MTQRWPISRQALVTIRKPNQHLLRDMLRPISLFTLFALINHLLFYPNQVSIRHVASLDFQEFAVGDDFEVAGLKMHVSTPPKCSFTQLLRSKSSTRLKLASNTIVHVVMRPFVACVARAKWTLLVTAVTL
jgi:hypothetical protein